MKDKPCKITQRTKSSPITIECKIPLPRNISLNPITLKVSASPEDWKVLYRLSYLDDPQYLNTLIWLYFTKTAMEKINSESLRGIHKRRDMLWLDKVKAYGACAYALASYWFKKPPHQWPDSFKKEFNLSLVDSNQMDSLNIYRITADHMERTFGKGRKKYKLAEWIIDNEATPAFKEMFIKQRGNPYNQVAEQFIKENLNRTPKEYYQKLFTHLLGSISE